MRKQQKKTNNYWKSLIASHTAVSSDSEENTNAICNYAGKLRSLLQAASRSPVPWGEPGAAGLSQKQEEAVSTPKKGVT